MTRDAKKSRSVHDGTPEMYRIGRMGMFPPITLIKILGLDSLWINSIFREKKLGACRVCRLAKEG